MRTTRLLLSGAATTALVLGSTTVAIGQEEAADEAQGPYFFGAAEGLLHHDMENPLDCAIGFTSDSTLTGDSTLGPVTIHQVNCYVPTDTLRNTPDGSITYTFDNGDTLSGTIDGDCVPDMVMDPDGVYTCVGLTRIDGGTGGLEGASGEIRGIAFLDNVHDEATETIPDAPYRITFVGLVES